MVKRNDAPVNLSANRTITYFSMNPICKIQRNRARRKLNNLTGRSKYENKIREEIHF
ncbi:hypothetical protein D3C78_927520 [compost metagenome]